VVLVLFCCFSPIDILSTKKHALWFLFEYQMVAAGNKNRVICFSCSKTFILLQQITHSMYIDFQNQLCSRLAAINNAGLFNNAGSIMSDRAVIETDGATILNFYNPDFLGQNVVNESITDRDSFASLERHLANLLNAESCLLFNSLADAYHAVSLQLVGRNDALIFDTPSQCQINATNYKSTKYKYHNTDIADIEKQLKMSQAQQNRILIIDAVNMATGAIAPLNQLFMLAEKYHCIVAVDQTFSAGIIGDNGGGVCELFGLAGKAEMEIGTLTKAFGCRSGAYIAGRKEIIDFLRQQYRLPSVASPVSPTDAASALDAIARLKENLQQRNYLQHITNYFIRKLYGLGFEIAPTQTNIMSVIVGNNLKAENMAQQLQKNGLLAMCLTNPLIDKDNARIVLQLSAQHSQKDIERAAEIFAKSAKAINYFGK